MPAPGARYPDLHFANRADGAALDELDHTAIVFAGVRLIGILRGRLSAIRVAIDETATNRPPNAIEISGSNATDCTGSGQARPSSGIWNEAVSSSTVPFTGSVTSWDTPLNALEGAAPARCQVAPSHRQVSCSGPASGTGVLFGQWLGSGAPG